MPEPLVCEVSPPFNGNLVSGLTPDIEAKMICHSSGRLVAVYKKSGLPMMAFTDVIRSGWEVDFPINFPTDAFVGSIACCEMSDGNIAVAYYTYISSHEPGVYTIIYSPTGNYVGGGVWLWHPYLWSANTNDFGIAIAFNGSHYRVIHSTSGGVYLLYTSTSTDLLIWSDRESFVPAELNINGFEYSFNNPVLLYPTRDNPLLTFDWGFPRTNVFLMDSKDGGGTWELPWQHTFYDHFNTGSNQPFISQGEPDTLLLTFREEVLPLYMPDDSPGWTAYPVYTYTNWMSTARILVFDRATRKIFYFQQETWYSSSSGALQTIDFDIWEASNYWDATTTPAFPESASINSHNGYTQIYNHKLAILTGANRVKIFDDENNEIREIIFGASGDGWTCDLGLGLVNGNVIWNSCDFWNIAFYYDLHAVHIAEDGWIYFCFTIGYLHNRHQKIGRIHIDDEGPIYTLEELWFGASGFYNNLSYMMNYPTGGWAGGNISLLAHTNGISIVNHVIVMELAVTFWFSNPGHNIPNAAVNGMHLENNEYIWILLSGQNGIWKLDISTGIAERFTPPISMGSPDFMEYDESLNMLMVTGDAGLHTFYIDNEQWEIYNDQTVPGITPNDTHRFRHAFYDSVNYGFVVGLYNVTLEEGISPGIVFVPLGGKRRQLKYAHCTNNYDPLLYMPRTTNGWSTGWGTDNYISTGGLAFDPIARTIYQIDQGMSGETKTLRGVTAINIDTWAVDAAYDRDSDPILPLGNADLYQTNRSARVYDGKFIFILDTGTIAIIDNSSGEVTYLNFHDGVGGDQNIDWVSELYLWPTLEQYQIANITITDDGILYVVAFLPNMKRSQLFSIDLNEAGPGYTTNSIVLHGIDIGFLDQYEYWFRLFPDEGMAISSCRVTFPPTTLIRLFTLIDNVLTKVVEIDTGDPVHGLPNNKLRDYWIKDGFCYMVFEYSMGIFKYDINNGTTEHFVDPTQNSNFNSLNYDPTLNALLCTFSLQGLYVFYLTDQTWGIYNKETISDSIPFTADTFVNAFYDAASDYFICGVLDYNYDNQGGIIAIPKIVSTDRSWACEPFENLVDDYTASGGSTAWVDGDESGLFYSLWTDDNTQDDENKLKWTCHRTIDVTPDPDPDPDCIPYPHPVNTSQPADSSGMSTCIIESVNGVPRALGLG